MTGRSALEREIREIAVAANCGEITDAQYARLDELVQSDPYLAGYTARIADQQASLAWQGTLGGNSSTLSLNATPPANESAHDVQPAVRAVLIQDAARSTFAAAWPTIAVGIAFLLGALAVPAMQHAIWPNLDGLFSPAVTASDGKAAYEARLVGTTACLWEGDSIASREVGSGLRTGESLHLLEGLAEFKLDWADGGSATLSLEGPAAMILTSDGMPMLRFGRMTATINSSSRPFVLETPVGRLGIKEYGSIGVSAFGNEGEIHVFDGSAEFDAAWVTPHGQRNIPVKVTSGEAIRVEEGRDGELRVSRHAADEGYFAAQQSMSSDALIIPASYVDAVMSAGAIAYWRFEHAAWPNLPNEMGPRFECRVDGSLGTTAHHNNEAIEFGVTDQGGEIRCDETFDDEISENYSVEFWIKPSHYHVGAVVSLVGDPESPAGVIPHGMLLELGGIGSIPTAVHHPGRIRFLHRSPASNQTELGTSCYTTAAYALRKWQHVVAVKDGSKMRLYIDGQLTGESADPSRLPSGLRLLAGRLYPSRQVRPFIGQLDELAIFNRALSPQEIAAHYRLVRPAIESKASI